MHKDKGERSAAVSAKKVTRIDSETFSTCPATQTTPFDHSGHLGSLFENLAQGETPDFLQMMAALSEIAYEMTGDSGPCFDCKRG